MTSFVYLINISSYKLNLYYIKINLKLSIVLTNCEFFCVINVNLTYICKLYVE